MTFTSRVIYVFVHSFVDSLKNRLNRTGAKIQPCFTPLEISNQWRRLVAIGEHLTRHAIVKEPADLDKLAWAAVSGQHRPEGLPVDRVSEAFVRSMKTE